MPPEQAKLPKHTWREPAASAWMRRQAQAVYRWLLANSFAPAWLPRGWQRPLSGYLVAALAQFVAVMDTTWLDRSFPEFSFPGLLAALAIVLVALTFGAGPSLLATVVGAVLLDYFVVQPYQALRVPHTGDVIGMGLLFAVGVTISVVASRIEGQRRKAQELAQEREAMLEAMPDSFIVCDEMGRIVQANSAARELFGPHGFDGGLRDSAAQRVARLAMRDIHGQPIPREQWPVIRVLRGETLKGPTSQDVQVQALTGRELLLNISGAPVRDREGHLIGAALVMRDVTAQRQLAEAVRASARRTHEALNALLAIAEVLVSPEVDAAASTETYAAAPIAKRLAELTCSVLGCRRVAILAVDPQTDIMRTVAVAGLSPEHEKRWWAEQQAAVRIADWPDQQLAARLRAGEVVNFDMAQPPYNRRPNPYAVRDILIAPMRMGERLVGLVTVDHGGATHAYTTEEIALAAAVAKLVALVVERERLLQQREEARGRAFALHDANQRMNDFLGVASHELKTPVTSLKVNVQLAARWLAKLARTASGLDPRLTREIEPIRDLLDRSDRTMVRLTRLVDDLLDVSRIRAGRLELRREPNDLVAIVRDAVQEQRAVVAEVSAEREIALTVPDRGSVPVSADSDRIGQVVTNYLTNALKYSPQTEPVEVRIEVHDAQEGEKDGGGRIARVSVRDYGPGLPAEELGQVWEPFHRAENILVQSGSGVGLGLGLFISKTIVERHGGHVGVESAPGHGSTFWFTLPLLDADAQAGK